MAKKRWTLINHAKGEYLENWRLSAAGVSARLRRLNSGLSQGVDVVEVDNGDFRFTVIPTRGMSVWKAWQGKHEIGWQSPTRGPVHPSLVDLGEPSGLGWLDGFDELLVRCGLESNGAPEFDSKGILTYPLHGRIGNRPAHHVWVEVDDARGEIAVHGVVEETRFHFFKVRMHSTIKTRVGEHGFRVHDVLENISASPAETQVLYHVNFGVPLLDAGSQVVAPVQTLVPRNAHAAEGVDGWQHYGAPQAGFEEQVYFFHLQADEDDQTQVLLKNAHGSQGVSLHYNVKQLPCYTVWKNTTAVADGYVTGLEPGTNFPNPRSYEGQQGRVAKLPGGGKTAFDLKLEFHADAAKVKQAENAVQKLQKQDPTIHRTPQKGWCEGA